MSLLTLTIISSVQFTFENTIKEEGLLFVCVYICVLRM